MYSVINQQSLFSLSFGGIYIANILNIILHSNFMYVQKLSSSVSIWILIAYSFYLNEFGQIEMSMRNLFRWLIRK